jgi:hypothetical protein
MAGATDETAHQERNQKTPGKFGIDFADYGTVGIAEDPAAP